MSTVVNEEFNPICWQKEDCANARKEFGATNPNTGFVTKEYPCLKEGWGKCLPAGQTTVSIAFGEKSQFTDLGDYFKTVYNYSMVLVGIVAVVVIIISGVQWTVSAGSSEVINSAKKRITGALVGMVIAYLSFVILNTINPALTSLRLPQVYLLRPQILTSEFCSDLQSTYKLAKGDGITNDTSDSEKKAAFTKITDFSLVPSRNNSYLTCGDQFFIQGSGGNTCKGDFCPNEQMCSDVSLAATDSSGQKKYSCVGAKVTGKVYSKSIFPSSGGVANCAMETAAYYASSANVNEGWATPWVQSGGPTVVTGLSAICVDGSRTMAAGNVTVKNQNEGKEQSFIISGITNNKIDDMVKDCEGLSKGFKGFVVFLPLNEKCDASDEVHAFGRSGMDVGYIDRKVLGAAAYMPVLAPLVGAVDALVQGDNTFTFNPAVSNSNGARIKQEYLLTADEIKKGVRLNIDVNTVQDVDTADNAKIYEKLMQ